MLEFLLEMTAWHWVGLGVTLLAIEVATGGVLFFMWFGIWALGVGCLVGLGLVSGWTSWWIGLTGPAASLAVMWRLPRKRHGAVRERPLNQPMQRYLHAEWVLDLPIVRGVGQVRLNDSVWPIQGPDVPAGTRVRVVRIDGICFIVEAL